MQLDRLPYDPGALADFYEEGLAGLGALCARSWHDRLEVVAEGRGAALWNRDGAMFSGELQFVPANASGPRSAAGEVFPGCPLTFALAEALRPAPLVLERAVLAGETAARLPEPNVLERLWRNQFPDTGRWRLTAPLARAHHFSLVALARCEIQAIDQHWTLQRVALGLPGGAPDAELARDLGFSRLDPSTGANIGWPAPDLQRWSGLLAEACRHDLAEEIERLRLRQEAHLRRELDRVDEYFDNYTRELETRSRRAGAKLKAEERLAAARAEHARHRADQVSRHEIVVHPHVDALLLVAEPAWRTTVEVVRGQERQSAAALYIPRTRRWELLGA